MRVPFIVSLWLTKQTSRSLRSVKMVRTGGEMALRGQSAQRLNDDESAKDDYE